MVTVCMLTYVLQAHLLNLHYYKLGEPGEGDLIKVFEMFKKIMIYGSIWFQMASTGLRGHKYKLII